MSVKYKLVQRPDFSKGAAKDAKKYFAQMLSNGNVSFDELCESIAEESSSKLTFPLDSICVKYFFASLAAPLEKSGR